MKALAASVEPFVLILDNCEHVADPVGDMVERIVAECPAVRVLVTAARCSGSGASG